MFIDLVSETIEVLIKRRDLEEKEGKYVPDITDLNSSVLIILASAAGMMLEALGQAQAAKAIEDAVIKIVATTLKSLAAGKMGYPTSEVGDMVAAGLK